jgi:serine/threonine protein kinase
MAVCSPNRFSELKECPHPRKLIAERVKVPRNFIIEQERVRLDTVSKFSRGAFAKAIRAKYNGADVRVKRIHAILTDSNRLDLHRFFQECRLASDLRHPNIVHFYGVVMDGRLPMLVMEELLCNLCEFIGHPEKFVSSRLNDSRAPLSNAHSAKLEDSQARSSDRSTYRMTDEPTSKPPQQKITERVKISIALGIAQGLDYLHTKWPYPIVHRDLSSSNILLGTFSYKTVAKIADFGQAKEIKSDDDWSSHNPGTMCYLPPEVLLLDTQQQEVEMDTKPLEVQAEADDQAPAQTDLKNENAPQPEDIEEVPEAQEPDNYNIRTSQESSVRSWPKLQTSIDMYMYGVLVAELGTLQPEYLEKKDSKDIWHSHHRKKLERLEKDSVFYRIASRCVQEKPSKRFKAVDVIAEITRQSGSMDIQPNQVSLS